MTSTLQLVLSLVDRSLELWNDSRKTKYQDSMLELKRAYAEEMDKDKKCDHNLLDHLEREMFLLSTSLETELRLASTRSPPNGMRS